MGVTTKTEIVVRRPNAVTRSSKISFETINSSQRVPGVAGHGVNQFVSGYRLRSRGSRGVRVGATRQSRRTQVIELPIKCRVQASGG